MKSCDPEFAILFADAVIERCDREVEAETDPHEQREWRKLRAQVRRLRAFAQGVDRERQTRVRST